MTTFRLENIRMMLPNFTEVTCERLTSLVPSTAAEHDRRKAKQAERQIVDPDDCGPHM